MRLMDDALIDLYDRGVISAEEAYERADQKLLMRQHLAESRNDQTTISESARSNGRRRS